jgi:hypothetical protein
MTRALTAILAAQFAATVAPVAAPESSLDSVPEATEGNTADAAGPAVQEAAAGPANLEATGS